MPIWPLGGCSNADALQCKCEYFACCSLCFFLLLGYVVLRRRRNVFSDPHVRLSEWRDCYPFCCTARSCPVPSPCACRLCAKHTKLLKPDELHRSSQEVSDADFDDEYVRVPCLFLLFFSLCQYCSDILMLAVVWSRW
jgi:hypothetical protein